MIEPSNNAETVSFEDVQNSPTIREVYRLIRTYWEVDPATVHILDIRPFISENKRETCPPRTMKQIQEMGYGVVAEVIDRLSPATVLSMQCTTADAENEIAKKLNGSRKCLNQPTFLAMTYTSCLLFKGFHPSTYLRYPTEHRERQSRDLEACFTGVSYVLRDQKPANWGTIPAGIVFYGLRKMAQGQGMGRQDGRQLTSADLLLMFNLEKVPDIKRRLETKAWCDQKIEALALTPVGVS